MITVDKNTMYGIAGGQLEFVSQRVEWRREPDYNGGRSFPVIIIRFTDHDCQANPMPQLIEGKYYEFEYPMAME